MNDPLTSLLQFLSEEVNDACRDDVDVRVLRALNWEPVDRPPLVVTYPLPEDAPFRPYPHREIFDDPVKMLYNELVCAFDTSIALHARVGDDLPLAVRANFGTVLVASMFGARVEQVDDNPPWVVGHEGGAYPLERIVDTDPADFSAGWIPRAAETMRTYREILDTCPELKRAIRIVLPDLQGPFDNLELIRGSEALMDLVAAPEAVARALDALATAQIGLAKYFEQWITEPGDGYCHQHAVALKGNVLLRNDTPIMVSPEMYREQISPSDERVLRDLGGGGIHSCGNFGHLADAYLELPSIRSLDFGQSEMNDVETIYAKAAAKRIALIRVAVSEEELVSGRARKRFPTGAVLIHRAESFESARTVARSYRESCKSER